LQDGRGFSFPAAGRLVLAGFHGEFFETLFNVGPAVTDKAAKAHATEQSARGQVLHVTP